MVLAVAPADFAPNISIFASVERECLKIAKSKAYCFEVRLHGEVDKGFQVVAEVV